jgi:hypothetical protein
MSWSTLVDYLDSDAKFASGSFDHPADIGVPAEPQLLPEGQACGQGFRDQPARPAVAGRDHGRFVGAGIEHPEHLGGEGGGRRREPRDRTVK